MISKTKKNTYNTLLMIAGLLLLVLLVSKYSFLGSLLGGYENTEPEDLGEFLAVIDLYNGQYNLQAPYVVGSHSYNNYYTNSDLGVINVMPVEDMRCNELLSLVNTLDNTTSYVVLKGRQVLDLNQSYLFCNFKNNLALKVSEYSVFEDYVDSFETFAVNEVVTQNNNNTSSEEPVTELVPESIVEDFSAIENSSENETFNNSYLLIGLVVFLVIVFFLVEKNFFKTKKKSRRRK